MAINRNKTKITFGKYKNKSVEYIYEHDLKYFKWLLEQDFFRKFNYYSIFKNYKPAEDHVKYCNDNGIKFCEFCCKKKQQRIHDRGNNFKYCGVCYNGDRSFSRSSIEYGDSEYAKNKRKEIKDTINKKQLAEYKKYIKKNNK